MGKGRRLCVNLLLKLDLNGESSIATFASLWQFKFFDLDHLVVTPNGNIRTTNNIMYMFKRESGTGRKSE